MWSHLPWVGGISWLGVDSMIPSGDASGPQHAAGATFEATYETTAPAFLQQAVPTAWRHVARDMWWVTFSCWGTQFSPIPLLLDDLESMIQYPKNKDDTEPSLHKMFCACREQFPNVLCFWHQPCKRSLRSMMFLPCLKITNTFPWLVVACGSIGLEMIRTCYIETHWFTARAPQRRKHIKPPLRREGRLFFVRKNNAGDIISLGFAHGSWHFVLDVYDAFAAVVHALFIEYGGWGVCNVFQCDSEWDQWNSTRTEESSGLGTSATSVTRTGTEHHQRASLSNLDKIVNHIIKLDIRWVSQDNSYNSAVWTLFWSLVISISLFAVSNHAHSFWANSCLVGESSPFPRTIQKLTGKYHSRCPFSWISMQLVECTFKIL